MINTYNNVMENNKFNKRHGGCKECRILEVYTNKQECVLAFNNGKIDTYEIRYVISHISMGDIYVTNLSTIRTQIIKILKGEVTARRYSYNKLEELNERIISKKYIDSNCDIQVYNITAMCKDYVILIDVEHGDMIYYRDVEYIVNSIRTGKLGFLNLHKIYNWYNFLKNDTHVNKNKPIIKEYVNKYIEQYEKQVKDRQLKMLLRQPILHRDSSINLCNIKLHGSIKGEVMNYQTLD